VSVDAPFWAPGKIEVHLHGGLDQVVGHVEAEADSRIDKRAARVVSVQLGARARAPSSAPGRR
jgi:hypothetical protein